jgi:hypothetical protein
MKTLSVQRAIVDDSDLSDADYEYAALTHWGSLLAWAERALPYLKMGLERSRENYDYSELTEMEELIAEAEGK